MSAAETIKQSLTQAFNLPSAAVDWLLMLWQVTQVFDDYADGDPVTRDDLNNAIWCSLVAMPQNEFFDKHRFTLSPLIAASILKWQASDKAEREGRADEKTFVWRAGFYDIVLMCVCICHGAKVATEHGDKVMALYGESCADYLKEANHA